MRRTHDVHVSVDRARYRWKVTRAGRILSRHATQRRAVTAGTRHARRVGVDVVTHGRDGRIRSKDSYGNEGTTRDTEH
jgi:hypothetical protein